MYTFLFDRRSLTLLLSGAGVAALLFFAAGVLVGLRINLQEAPVATAEFQPLSAFEGGLVRSAEAGAADLPALPAAEPAPAAPTAPEPPPVPAAPLAAAPQPASPAVVATEPPPAPMAAEPREEPQPAVVAVAQTPASAPPSPASPTDGPPTAGEPAAAMADLPPVPAPVPVPMPTAPSRAVEAGSELRPIAPQLTELQPLAEEAAGPADPVLVPAPQPPAAEAVAAVAPESEPVATRPAPPEAVPAAAQPGAYVQVGAFGVAANAQKRLALVLAEGFPGYIATLRSASGGTLSAVRFGGYPTLRAAFADAQKYLAGGPGREAIVQSAR